jgi:hypothetical protein
MSEMPPAPLRTALTVVRVAAGAGALMIAISTSLASQRMVRAAGPETARPVRAEQTPVATGDNAVTTCGGDIAT